MTKDWLLDFDSKVSILYCDFWWPWVLSTIYLMVKAKKLVHKKWSTSWYNFDDYVRSVIQHKSVAIDTKRFLELEYGVYFPQTQLFQCFSLLFIILSLALVMVAKSKTLTLDIVIVDMYSQSFSMEKSQWTVENNLTQTIFIQI